MRNILLIGLGKFGSDIAKYFYEQNQQVMAIDIDEDKVNKILPYVTYAQVGNTTNIEFLHSLGINDYDVCIVAIGKDFQSSMETTALLKELGAKLVVSRAATDIHEKFLLKNGADEVVFPEKQLALWTAYRYSDNHVHSFFNISDDKDLFEIDIPTKWKNKSIRQLKVRSSLDINIMAINVKGKFNFKIDPDYVFTGEEHLVVVADEEVIRKTFG